MRTSSYPERGRAVAGSGLGNPRGSMLRLRAPELGAALCGVASLLLLGGGRAIAPGNLDWLGRGDRASQLVAWLMFRNEPWQWPLGRIDGLLYPAGTTVAFVDAIPLLAVIGRVASPVLPADFQYFGLWLALSFALQGWFGARLVGCWSKVPLHRVLGGALFTVAPPLVARAVDHRTLHPSLCGQWLLVAMLARGCLTDGMPRAARASIAVAGLWVVVAATIHPSLAAMVLMLALALVARLAIARALGASSVLAWSLFLVALAGTALWAVGYFDGTPLRSGGFGYYSADLLFAINPIWPSPFLPQWPMGPGQYEGAAYLGFGVVLLLVVSAVSWISMRRRAAGVGLWPFAAASGLLTLFALSSRVSVAGRPLLTQEGLYNHLGLITGAFRSSGRFVWPLHYLIIVLAIAGVLRAWARHPRIAAAALAGALALQVIDIWPARREQAFVETPWRLSASPWLLAAGHYRHVVLVPPQVASAGPPCNGEYAWDHYVALAYVAYRLGATFNSGWVPRVDATKLVPSCRADALEVTQGALRDDSLYVIAPWLVGALPRRGAVCGDVDSYVVCVSATAATPFRDLLARAQLPADRGSESDEVTSRTGRHATRILRWR